LDLSPQHFESTTNEWVASVRFNVPYSRITEYRLLRCFLVIWLGILASLPAADAWHTGKGAFRKKIKVDTEGAGPVTATTTVFLDDRFTGFVLVDATGKLRPCSLLNRAGSMCKIHFDAAPGETLYLYLSAKADLPRPGLRHKAGLRHRVRTYDGREVTSSAIFKDLWDAGALQGGRFVNQVYSSFNPFGPNTNALHCFDGFLRIKKAGTTQFCIASTDASFLHIDGKEVVAWPGKHPVNKGLKGEIRGGAVLKPGLHRFTFLHANSGSTSYAIAAMVLPGETKHFVIGPEYFTHPTYAFVGPLTGKPAAAQADFVWDNHYMLNIREHCLHQVNFEAARIKDAPPAAFSWDFGDGTTGKGMRAEHFYFKRGDYPVTLRVKRPGGHELVSHQTIHIAPRYGQSENDDRLALQMLGKAVRQEKTIGIQPQGYALITHGYYFFLKERKAADFAQSVVAAADRIPETDLYPLLIKLALAVQQVDEQYDLAEKCFRLILDKVKDPGSRAFTGLHYAGMLNLCLNRPMEARQLLAQIAGKDLTNAWDRRLLEIYRADTSLVLDDYATAQKQYVAIATPQALLTSGQLDRKLMFDYSSRAFRIQNLLSQKLFRQSLEELEMLEWQLPEERLSPSVNLLKVHALMGNNQPRKAIVCAQRALLAKVDDTYRPKLRLELARAYLHLRQFVKAQRQVSLIRKESPWTLEEIEARKLLGDIDRSIEETTQ
jgi:hypothetical protein